MTFFLLLENGELPTSLGTLPWMVGMFMVHYPSINPLGKLTLLTFCPSSPLELPCRFSHGLYPSSGGISHSNPKKQPDDLHD